MTNPSAESRRDGIVERFKAAKAGYERCVGDVAPEVGLNGSEWSFVDLLNHSMDRDYQDMARRFTEESSPQFVGRYDPAKELRDAVEGVLASIDDALNVATSLTSEQLDRVGQRRGQPFAALDALELSVAHFEEHLAQLRDEVRPRESLPPVSA